MAIACMAQAPDETASGGRKPVNGPDKRNHAHSADPPAEIVIASSDPDPVEDNWITTMDCVYKAWQAMKGVLRIRCAAHAFSLVEEVSHPEAFGSRYALFRRGIAALRFIWDGKDGWFILEHTEDVNAKWPEERWQEITHVQFSPKDPAHDENTVISGLMPPLEEFLARFREEPAYPIVDTEGFYRSIRCLAIQLRSEGHTKEADRLGILMGCAWTTGSELIGELLLSLQAMKGQYSDATKQLRAECLRSAEQHLRIPGRD